MIWVLKKSLSFGCLFCLFDLILYVPGNNLSVMSGQVFMGWTSTKQGFSFGWEMRKLIRITPHDQEACISDLAGALSKKHTYRFSQNTGDGVGIKIHTSVGLCCQLPSTLNLYSWSPSGRSTIVKKSPWLKIVTASTESLTTRKLTCLLCWRACLTQLRSRKWKNRLEPGHSTADLSNQQTFIDLCTKHAFEE